MTTLLIDLGNTALKWTTPEEADTPHTVVHHGSTQGKDELYRNWLALRPSRVIGCTVASPTLAFSATKFFNDHDIPWEWVRSESMHEAEGFTLTNAYERTGQLGPDRWYAAIGALSLFAARPFWSCTPAPQRPWTAFFNRETENTASWAAASLRAPL